MEVCQQPLLLLCLAAVIALNILGSNAVVEEEDELVGRVLFLLTDHPSVTHQQVKNSTNKLLRVIPRCGNGSSVTKLVIEGSLITLNKTDRLALASYPRLVELHLDGNLVTGIPAKYFSVVPHLRVLSLSRNKISSLDPESFSGLDDLRELDLSHNLLTSLHTELFRQLHNLQVLNLKGNPWNCSSLLLSSNGEAQAAGVTIGGPQVTCACPEKQATAVYYPSPQSPFTTDPQKPPTPVNSQQSAGSSTMLKTTLTSSQNHNILISTLQPRLGQTAVPSNTWKFTACVAAVGLSTAMLIVCAIKGPSWYKLFHNYRHRRLHQEEDEEENVASTAFSETGTHLSQRTFTFEQDNGRIEEEEDGYFEDPYIRREE
ncbi:leucine-rich repeat-containing protein 19-like [Enoplosus armatus]|uniref:leucine-rich repeat-containing protein 19-like n=1 Tax=Enoplosus armatus TaxID=215367 RepID=UPI0039953728